MRRLRPRAGQLELDTDLWRHHGIFTDRVEPLLQAEGEHRGHAIVEQVNRRPESRPAGALPGSFNANAGWLALTAIAHNLTRAVGTLAAHEFTVATTTTIRDKLIKTAGRMVRSARRYHLRLVEQWPWQTQLNQARRRVRAIPLRI